MDLTFQLLEKYLYACTYQKNLNEKTVKAYRIDLSQFISYYSEQRTQLNRDTINKYIAHLNQCCKPRSVKRKMASLKAFCTWMEEEDYLSDNPFRKLRIKLNEPFVLPKTISLSVIEQMLAAAYQAHEDSCTNQERKISLRDIATMEILFATGMRVSELCGLNTEDIDLTRGTVKIHGKGSKERILQITNDSVMESLRKYIEEYQPCEQHPFFLTQRHTRLAEQSVRLCLQKYAEQIGVSQHITPHMFRHSFATLLLEEDVDIRYIQQLLGHSSIVTTQIYTHVTTAKQRDILLHKHPRNKISI